MPDGGFPDGLNDGEGEEGGGTVDPKPEPAQDAEWDESKHPRAENGQFGEGGGNRLPEEAHSTKQPSIAVKGNELGTFEQTKDLRKAAMQYARENFVGKSYTNRDSGHEIQVTWQGIKHATAGANAAELTIMAKLDELLIHAKKDGEAVPDYKGRAHIISAQKYQAVVDLDGESLNIGIVTLKKHSGHEHYDHFIIKDE